MIYACKIYRHARKINYNVLYLLCAICILYIIYIYIYIYVYLLLHVHIYIGWFNVHAEWCDERKPHG